MIENTCRDQRQNCPRLRHHLMENDLHKTSIRHAEFVDGKDSEPVQAQAKGPHTVTINITKVSPEITGSKLNSVTSCLSGLSPLQACQGKCVTTVVGGRNGFSIKRDLPRGITGDRVAADVLASSSHTASVEPDPKLLSDERRLENDQTGSLTSSKHRQNYHELIDSAYQENQSTKATNMSGEVAGVSNPAFTVDDAVSGTPGSYKKIDRNGTTQSNGIHEIIDSNKDSSAPKNEPTRSIINVNKDTIKSDLQERNVPTAQVAPTIHSEQNTGKSDDILTNPDSVEIAIVADEDKKADDETPNGKQDTDTNGPSVAVNMELKRVKGSVKKTNSLQDIFAKVKSPSPESLDAKDEDTKWLEWIELKFKDIAGDDGEISREEFKVALGVKKSFFAERFFELFDQDASGTIELGELMDGLRMLTKGSSAQKLQFLFDVYDVDGSGTIERDELKAVLLACIEESSLSLTDENLDDLTDVLFDAADADESGSITFEELQAELEKHPGVIENLTISAAQWLKPPTKSKKKFEMPRYFNKKYLANNCRKVVYFFLYWIVNIVLFAVAAGYQYRDANHWIQVARGCGLCLNFNCMWILVLMLRKCLTFIRMTKLCHVLPLDQHILFHKMTGIAIAGFSLVHSVAHVGNAATVSNTTPLEMWEVLFTTKAEVGYVGGSAFITGWILDVILIVIVICSMPFVRRAGYFQVFYWTHMLYVPFWIGVILHGPHFWKWFIVPGVMFIMEKISRSKIIKMARYGDTYIDEVNLLPSGVTHLIITRPLNFKYQPGDYIFLQIPVIAKHEWHPFTISSAPEMEGHIWLHVRSAGHWTNKLYKYFEELKVTDPIRGRRQTVKSQFSGFQRAFSRKDTASRNKRPLSKTVSAMRRQTNKLVKVKCFVDGPYGTGTREVFNTDHAVLIGTGIGVTPMASILQSVWYRFNASKKVCPNCTHTWYSEEDMCDMKLQKVDFVWINRDQRAFEWFLTILSQLELEQSAHHGALERCIQTHLYMTAAQKKTDMKGIGLQIALELMYEKSQVDLITGLRTKTEAGRPDFNKIFKSIKAENHGKVKVFFCGAPQLGTTVKEAAQRFAFAFSKENF